MKKQAKNIYALANELLDFLIQNDLWMDSRIYFDGICYATHKPADMLYEIHKSHKNVYVFDADPNSYFEYNGDYLSMSFEGPLYSVLNYQAGTYGDQIIGELEELFKRYGLYYELGNSWNMSLYNI